MRKNTHPNLTLSSVQSKDGAIFKKNWLFFRAFLQLDLDTSNHGFWSRNTELKDSKQKVSQEKIKQK